MSLDGSDPDSDQGESDDWTYAVDEVGENEDDYRLEPGSPDAENALFVVLGVVLTILVIARGLGVV